jgi:hypothetical protein
MLKAGVPPEASEDSSSKKSQKGGASSMMGGYRFSGNTLEIFDNFFGTDNPFTITLDSNHPPPSIIFD